MTPRQLRLIDLSMSIGGTQALSAMNYTLTAGQWTTFTGPTGAGKSVLIQTLAGLHRPDHGEILVDGEPAPWLAGAQSSRPGVVLQTSELVPFLTVAESVALPLQALRCPKAEIARRTNDWLAAVGLTAAATQLVSELSGGQRQRTAIARALAVQSGILLLDEPTAELDAANRNRILDLLREQVKGGTLLVVASNDRTIHQRSDTVLLVGEVPGAESET